MLNRIKLAIKIILGYDIIVYEENTKIVNLVINNNLDIIDTKHDYAIDKGRVYKDNNGEIRYWGVNNNKITDKQKKVILNNLDLLENWQLEEIIEMIGIDDLDKKYASELIKDIFEVEKEIAGISYEDIC